MRLEELEKMHRLEDQYWWFVGRRQLLRNLIERYAPEAGLILDVGCGTGGTLSALEHLGTVVGADLSEDALGFCRQRGHRCLVCSCAEDLAFADGAFGAAVCADVFEHLQDDGKGFSEVLRILRPGGIVVVTVPAYPWLWSEHDEALSHKRRYLASGLRGRLTDAGAEMVRLSHDVSFVFPIVLAVRLLNRLRLRRLGKPHTQLMSLPGWLNRFFTGLQAMEAWIVTRVSLPVGTSIVAVARKPNASEGYPHPERGPGAGEKSHRLPLTPSSP